MCECVLCACGEEVEGEEVQKKALEEAADIVSQMAFKASEMIRAQLSCDVSCDVYCIV